MDFNGLNKGDSIYVINKTDMGPEMVVGEVVDKNAPHYDLQNQAAANSSGMQQVIDLSVRFGDRVEPMRNLTVSKQTESYNGGKQIVCCDKESVLREIDRMMAVSRGEIERDAYNRNVLEKGEVIIESLNPKYKEDKEQKAAIAMLKDQVSAMMGMMQEIQSSLKSAKKS